MRQLDLNDLREINQNIEKINTSDAVAASTFTILAYVSLFGGVILHYAFPIWFKFEPLVIQAKKAQGLHPFWIILGFIFLIIFAIMAKATGKHVSSVDDFH